ncbi:MAG TPA: PAS domain S-box protein, partial [bacterium]|nr:PAS domain S-box protein [bacterium]
MNARVKLILGITFFFLVFLGAIAYFSIKRLETDTQWIDHSHQIIHSLQKTYADLKDAQTNYAEFLLTQKSQYASACGSSMDKLDEDIHQADGLASTDPILQKDMDQLRSLIEKKSTSMRVGLAYVKAGRPDLAVKPIQNEDVKKTDWEIKNLVDQMSGVQIWLLKTRQAFEQAGTQKNVRFMAMGTFLALLACGLAGYSINRQIHERQAALNSLKSSEEKFRFLAESANDAFITADSGGKISDVNPAGEALFGYSKEELKDKPLSLLLLPKEPNEPGGLFFEKFAAMTLGVRTLELNGRKKDGTEFPLELSLSQWKTRDGVFYTAIIRDIMERKFFIKTLLNNEHRLFQFLDAIPVGVLVRDPSGAPYYANQKAKEIFGTDTFKSGDDTALISETRQFYVAGTNQMYPTDQLPMVRALAGEKSHVDNIEMRQSDRSFFLESWGTPILNEKGELKFALSSQIDITHQKQITESLKEREEFFRNLFEEGPIGMTLTFSDGIYINVNRAFSDMLGYAKNELVGRSFADFSFSEDLQVEKNLTQKLFGKILPRYQIEKRFITKKGELLWCKVSSSVIRDLNDEPLFRLSIVENITDQKSSETVLKESEEKFRTLTESANDSIISADSKGLVIFFNPTAEKIFGY